MLHYGPFHFHNFLAGRTFVGGQLPFSSVTFRLICFSTVFCPVHSLPYVLAPLTICLWNSITLLCCFFSYSCFVLVCSFGDTGFPVFPSYASSPNQLLELRIPIRGEGNLNPLPNPSPTQAGCSAFSLWVGSSPVALWVG